MAFKGRSKLIPTFFRPTAHTSHRLPLSSGYDRRGSGTNGCSAARRAVQSAQACPFRRTNPRYGLCNQGGNQEVGLFTVYQFADESDSLFRVHRQVGCYHLHTPRESLAQSRRWYTLATGIESVQEHYLLHKTY